MTKPITPKEVPGARKAIIPSFVIDVFNRLIVKNYSTHQSVVMQDDVVRELQNMDRTLQEIFDNGWLDVEAVFEEAGWYVEYDKPGYNETYDAFFTFKPRAVI